MVAPPPAIEMVARTVLEGSAVFVLGPNVYDDSERRVFEVGRIIPTAYELAAHLAERSEIPGKAGDLSAVAEYTEISRGKGRLIDELDAVFRAEQPPTRAHSFIARLPSLAREHGGRGPVVVADVYDDVLERALDDVGEEYDVIWWDADGARGFLHAPPREEPRRITRPNAYTDVSPDIRPVLVKPRGTVRRDSGEASYLITEDDLIRASGAELISLLPVLVRERVADADLVFLGESLADRMTRLIVALLMPSHTRGRRDWAVQPRAREVERRVWQARDVELLDASVSEFVHALDERLGPSQRPQNDLR
jgi:hypothetical protein